MTKEITDAIKAIQSTYPGLRFCQIISIAASKAGWNNPDLFYCEDSVILDGLRKYITSG